MPAKPFYRTSYSYIERESNKSIFKIIVLSGFLRMEVKETLRIAGNVTREVSPVSRSPHHRGGRPWSVSFLRLRENESFIHRHQFRLVVGLKPGGSGRLIESRQPGGALRCGGFRCGPMAEARGRRRLRGCCPLALFLLNEGMGLGHHLSWPFQPADPETQGREGRSS